MKIVKPPERKRKVVHQPDEKSELKLRVEVLGRKGEATWLIKLLQESLQANATVTEERWIKSWNREMFTAVIKPRPA